MGTGGGHVQMHAGQSEEGWQGKPGPPLSEGKRGVVPDTSCTHKCTWAKNEVSALCAEMLSTTAHPLLSNR